MSSLLTPTEITYITHLAISLACGLIVGIERELKRKPAGISTQSLVIAAAMTFTFLSLTINPDDPTRIAAQIVSGVGFLGAGVILKSESTTQVSNLTTAASIWYAAAIGMAIGAGQSVIAITATLFSVLISRIPHVSTFKNNEDS